MSSSMKDSLIRWLIRLLQHCIEWLFARQNIPVWRSFNGAVTPINEMNDGHLINTIKRLKRNGGNSPHLPFLEREYQARQGRGSDVKDEIQVGDKVTTYDGSGTVTMAPFRSRGHRWVRVKLDGSSFEGPYLVARVKRVTARTRKK